MEVMEKEATPVALERDYYKVLLVGPSGDGKTYSFRNMNPETTGFINVENKPLPFPNKFKNHKKCNSWQEAYETLAEYAKNPQIDCIVFDSFSAYTEMLLAEARATKKNFDIWNMYNDNIGLLLSRVKKVKKEVFITAHYEILGIEGAMEKRVKAKGKEWEGLIEKEFSLVLYSGKRLTDKGVPEYFYNAFQEGTSAKCPPDLLKGLKIPNDTNEIFQDIKKFTNK